jgi:hypothetical protein
VQSPAPVKPPDFYQVPSHHHGVLKGANFAFLPEIPVNTYFGNLQIAPACQEQYFYVEGEPVGSLPLKQS